jgi:hypothetical protein
MSFTWRSGLNLLAFLHVKFSFVGRAQRSKVLQKTIQAFGNILERISVWKTASEAYEDDGNQI